MPLSFLTEKIEFPNVENADSDGLLAIGGDLAVERLLLAYRSGIFPWFSEDELPMWWSPDPRFVLFPNELKVSKSMKQVIHKNEFEFRSNTAFVHVIRHCKNACRVGQDGTWITPEIVKAYTQLFKLGHAYSAETWEGGKLVGGLYGVRVGKVFCGESMFTLVPNASKFAFINFVKQLHAEGVELIDCQVYTQHLESFGARMIPRRDFLKMLKS